MCSPRMPYFTHMLCSPRPQYSQRPHERFGFTATRSPTFDVPDRRADLGHVARDVAAGPEGQGQGEAGQTLADEEIEVVQRRGADAHQDVARPDHGVRDVLVPELVEPAVLLEGQRLQAAPSPAFGAFTSTAMLP